VIEAANVGSGLLCTPEAVGRKKVRHCAAWLDNLGFTTTVTERKYTEHDHRSEDEPGIALCGFDRAQPRSFLGKTGFGMAVECGLGDSLADYRRHCRNPSAGSSGAIDGQSPVNCREVNRTLPDICPANILDISATLPAGIRRHHRHRFRAVARLIPVFMTVTDSNSIRQAAAEFQPCRRPRFQNLQPWREVIIELRDKGASCEAIAGLLTRHGVKTSRTMVNEFVWTLPQPKVNRRRKPQLKPITAPAALSPVQPPVAPMPSPEPLPSAPVKSHGPRIAQVRMLKPQNP